MISRSHTGTPIASAARMPPVARFAWLCDFWFVTGAIPSVISNRIYTFPKYAVFSAFYAALERRIVVSRFAATGEQALERLWDLHRTRDRSK
jgi:hypothetical protein